MIVHNICEHMDIIKRYARVGLSYMRKPTDYTLDDMIQIGAEVFVIASKTDKGKSKFTTYLRTCLRNKYVTMMKKSFSNTRETIDRVRDVRSRNNNISHEQMVESREFVCKLMTKLRDREKEYVVMVLADIPRNEIRKRMKISFNTESKIRKAVLIGMLNSGYRL